MPVTRSHSSRTGPRPSPRPTPTEVTAETDTETSSGNSATDTNATVTTESTETGTAATTTNTSQTDATLREQGKQTPAENSTEQKTEPPPAAGGTQEQMPIENEKTAKKKERSAGGSCNRSSKSRRAQRLAQAKEELLKLQIELAAARVTAIEEEYDTEEEANTLISADTPESRVSRWLNNSRLHMLAITDQPHPTDPAEEDIAPCREKIVPNVSGTTAPPTVNNAQQQTAIDINYDNAAPPTVNNVQQQTSIEKNFDTTAPTAVYNEQEPILIAPKKQNKIENGREQDRTLLVPAGEIATRQPQRIDITELASAIALAARAGQQLAPRHLTDLPPFNGSHQEWLSFRAAYNESSASFTLIDNVARLRRSLRGRAKEAVENLLIYSTNPDDIMKTLESRFGRPDSIALAELERLRALPRLSDSPKDLCIFATRVSNIVTALRALQKIHYLYNPEVTKITVEKLTVNLRYRWYDFVAEQNNEEADLLKLARFLEREAERCSIQAQHEPIHADTTTAASKKPQRTYATAATTSSSSSTVSKGVTACPICASPGHTTTECKKFKDADINGKWDLAKTHHLCFRCLRHRGRIHSCRSSKCGIDGCYHWHHRQLHFVRKDEKPVKTESVTSTWSTSTSTQAYLKIVPVRASGPDGDVHTYALLDDGSTVSLIDNAIVQKIGATGPVDPLRIEAIGDTEVDASASRRVTLTLHGATSDHRIQARTINNLRLSTQEITASDLHNCAHLTDIRHHLTYPEVKPKILIGQDNWQLLLASSMKTGAQHQPVASLTPLGWVLHSAHTRALNRRVGYVNNCSKKK